MNENSTSNSNFKVTASNWLNCLPTLNYTASFTAVLLLCFCNVLNAQKITQQFTFSTKDVKVSDLNGYDMISLGDNGSLQGEENAGMPQLPVVTFNLLLPDGASATGVNISNSSETKLSGNFDVHPVQMPQYPDFEEPSPFVDPNNEIYSSSKSFPEANILSFQTKGYREYNYVSISFIPFRYVPGKQLLYLLTNIQIDITYNSSPKQEAHKLRPYNGIDNEAYQQIQNMISNPDQLSTLYPSASTKSYQYNNQSGNIISGPLESTSLPSLEGGEVVYVIITNNTDINGNPVGNFTTKFQEFANWKTQSGSPAKVVSVDDIRAHYSGVDVPEKIRNFIKEAHQLWGTEYVLLAGIGDVVPVRWINGTYMPTDLYYSAIYHPQLGYEDTWNADGDDIFGESSDNADFDADIGIGRAPVDTDAEVDIFLKKNFTYARCSFAQTIPDGSWLGKQLMGYGSAFDVNWNSINALRIAHEIIQDHHTDIDMHKMFEYYEPRNLACNDPETWGLAYFPLHSNCTTNQVPNMDQNLYKDDIIDQINTGYGMINILEHGGPYGLGLGKVTQAIPIITTDFTNLIDTKKYGVLLAGGCHSATIERDFYIGERWVNSPGGGVAYYGASGNIGATSSYNFNKKFFDVLHDQNQHKLGKIHGITAMELNSNYLSKIFQLLGDPDLSIYTDVPSNLAVSHATSINNGNQDFTVNVSNIPSGESVRVCLYKENEVLTYIETNSFPVTFNITPDTEGLMRVTATCHNTEPYEADVTVNQFSGVHLYRSNMTVIDENSNGFIEPGETINLQIELSNTGATNASNISSILTTTDPNTLISQANSGYPNIASGQSGTSLVNYIFTASTTPNPGNVIPFDLSINTSQGAFNESFILNTRSADLEMGNRSVLVNGIETNTFNANDVADLYIDIKNLGNVIADNIEAVLSTNLESNIASVMTGNYNYGDIDILSTVTNNSPFVVNIGPNYNGQELIFQLTLTDDFGKEDVFEFSLTEEYPPLISGFDYTASNDFITPTWNSINNISGYHIFRSDTENGNYVQLNDLIISSAAMYNDLQVMALTGYWYKVSVVTLSGNELALENLVPYYANTTLGYHGGFPIQSQPLGQLRTISSPTVYDVNGDGNKEIFLNLRTNSTFNDYQGRIMGFYESGQELFDIDGNQTNVGGFAVTEDPIYANSAIGDIDNDGEAEIFAIGRDPGTVFGYRTTDSDGDGLPDPLWDNGEISIGHRVYRNPVLSDLDNDGFMEIIILDEKQRVSIYDHNKNLLGVKQLGNEDYSEGELAIVDTDDNGYKEIIISCEKVFAKGAIYIWRHNGNYNTDPTLLKLLPGKRADSGPVIADIDGDGNYELMTIVKNGTVGYLYGLNIEDGSYINFNWAGTITMALPNGQYQGHVMPRIAVGDLDNDGILEVVFGSLNNLYVVNNQGSILTGFPKQIINSGVNSPILADIDNDDEVEIIINENGELNAYDYTGDACFGWPLQSQDEYTFVESAYVGDIDNDGMNEVVIGSENYTTYVWDTPGSSEKVEWGSYRGNAQNTAVYKEECKFAASETVVINGLSDVVWTADRHIQGDLIVKANSQLTIKSKITFTSDGAVIVEPGGSLVIDGGTLTTSCNGLWKGIKVRGNSSASQTTTNQGVLTLLNDSKIENAEIGIFVGNSPLGTTTSTTGGGIIKVKSTTFLNNIVGIEMLNYKYENNSYIKGNTFETTDYLSNRGINPETFIKFWNVGTIQVDENSFKNVLTIDPYTTPAILENQGNGITNQGADLEINKNTFENLNIAIDLKAGFAAFVEPINRINANTFYKNWISVKMKSVNKAIVISNKINVFATYLDGQGEDGSCGLHITSSNDFHIEDNDFSSTTNQLSTGIFIKDCKAKNEIYRNWFTDLSYGIYSKGRNREAIWNSTKGLQIICNKFDKNATDIYVAPKSYIDKNQGTDEMSAGNKFYPECSTSIKEFNNQSTLIYYSAENIPEYVPDCNNNVTINYTDQHNTCMSKLDDLGLVSNEVVSGRERNTNKDFQSDTKPNIEDAISSSKLKVSPNPSTGYFVVETPSKHVNPAESTILIKDNNGKIVTTIIVEQEKTEVSTINWSEGIYFISLFQNQKLISTAKVIVL